MKSRNLLAAALAAFAVTTPLARAIDIVWGSNLGAGPWTWNTGGNWTGGTAPIVNTDRGDLRKDWTISVTPTINFNTATITNGILFDDTGASNDSAVIIGNGGTAANTLTLSGTTPVIQVSGSTLTTTTVLAGTTAWSKTGAGTLILQNAANTITGAITVTGGVLQIFDGNTNTPTFMTAGALSGSSITVQNSATLDLPRLHATTTQNVTWNVPAVTLESGSTLRFRASTGSDSHSMAAAITNSGSTTINNNGGAYSQDIALTGKISGSGTINYLASSGSGSSTTVRTLTLNNTTTNYTGNWFVDYTGTTSDDFVALRSSATGALGTGTVTLDDRAQLINNSANGINSLAGVTIQKATSTLTLNGANAWNNASATLTLAAGTVSLPTANSTIGTLTASGNATINSTGGTLTASTITVSAGTLSGTGVLVPAASGSLLNTGATAGVTISNNIDFSNAGVIANIADLNPGGSDLFLTGTITGSAGFTKNGTGTLALNGTTTIGGLVTVNTGALQLNTTTVKSFTGGLAGSGSINVGGTGLVTLSGASASYTGTVTVADNALFTGEATTAGPLVIGSTIGAKLYPDTSTPTGAYTATNLTLNGVTSLNFPVPPTAGYYTILKYTGTLTGTAANLSLASYRGASLDMGTGSNSEISLTIAAAVPLVWNNAASTSIWATGTEQNWLNGAANDVFFAADTVTFDDTPAASQSITITGTVEPGSVTFSNNSHDYDFSGGAIGGPSSLVKGGGGMLTLLAANSYGGGTILNTGTLRIGDSGALGSAGLTINGGVLSSDSASPISIPNAISLAGNATIGNATDNGVVTLAGTVALANNINLTVDSDIVSINVISGAKYLSKMGAATMTLTAANTYSTTSVDDGTLQVGNGGTTGSISGNPTINAPGTLRYFRSDAPLTLANYFSGDGTLAFKGTGTSGQSAYALTGDNIDFTGGLTIESGARVQADNSVGGNHYGTGTVTVQAGGQAYLQAGTFTNAFNIAGNGWTEAAGQLGALRVNGTITGPITLTAAARISPYSGTGTISGTLTGTNALEINSTDALVAGTLTYSGDGSGFTGPTTVSQGTLNLTGSLGGALNVSSTAFAAGLSGEGSVGGILTLGAVGKNAALAMNPNTPGALTSTGALNMAEAGTVVTVNFSTAPTVVGTYTVLNHGGTTATAANFTLGSPDYRPPVFDTTTNPAAVTMAVTAANLTWEGPGGSAIWDLNTTANWETPGPVAEKFYHLDSVTFDDNAAMFAPTLAVTVDPSSVTFNNSLNAYTLTGAGAISGAATLTKTGTNSATISTANTFTGNVTVNNGKLVLGNAAAFGAAGSKSVTVNAAGQMDFNGTSPGTTRTYTYKIAGTGDGTGALVNSSATSISTNAGIQNLELLANASIGGAGRFDIARVGAVSGTITGGGFTLTKAGANQIQLRGAATGLPAIIVDGGTLGAEDSDLAFGGATGNVTVNNTGTLATYGVRSIATPVTLNTGSTLGNLGGGAGTWTGTITTSGSVTVNPAGQTINLNGTVAGTGTITVPALGGILNLTGTNTYTGGLIITHASNSVATTVNLPATYSLAVTAAKPILVGNNTGSGATAAQTFNVAGTVTNNGTLFVGRSGFLNVNSGAVWTQNGDMTVAGQGGYTATMNVNAGSSFTYAGTNTIKINPGSSGFGYLYIDGTFTTSRGFETTVTGAATYLVTLRNGGTLKLSAGIADLTTGTPSKTQFALGTGGGIIDTNGYDAGLSRGITGTGFGLTKQGGGKLTLTGTNGYTGATVVSGGTLSVGGTGTINTSSSVTIGTASTAAISEFNYSSTTTLTKSVSFATGSTGGTLSGSGTITPAVTVTSGNTYTPGGKLAPGTQTLTGGITCNSGSTFAVDIDSTTDTADKLVSSAAVDITGATVSFAETGSGIITAGTKLVIIDYTGTTLAGTFSGYNEGDPVSVGANTFTLSYADSSKVTLTSTTVASGYGAWALDPANGLTAGINDGADQDPDNDGIDNLLEYILGGKPMTSDPSILPDQNKSGSNLIFTYSRNDNSKSDTTQIIEYGNDLIGWTPVTVPAASDTVGGLTFAIAEGTPTTDPDTVEVTIPTGGSTEFFARLKATKP